MARKPLLTCAAGSAFDFDFQTDFGKIKSDFELTFKGVPDEDHWVGKVNEGGSKVTAATQNGNITIEIIK